MNANANMAARLNKTGFKRHFNSKAKRFVDAALDGAEAELAYRGDLEIRKSGPKISSGSVSGELRITAKSGDVLEGEIGTETRPPNHEIENLLRDPAVRARIMRRAASTLK